MWTFHLLCISCTILSLNVETSVGQSENNTLKIAKSLYGKDFKQGTSCGGHFEGPAGVINYKVNKPLSTDGETCVWTILLPRKGAIRFRIIQDGLGGAYANSDQITYLKWESQEMTTAFKVDTHPNHSPIDISGDSFFQVVFTSDGNYDGTRTGFSLFFEGIGGDTETGGYYKPVFNIVEQLPPSRQLDYPGDFDRDTWEFFMLTIHPEIDKQIVLTIEDIQHHGVYWYPIGCSVFGTLMVHEYGWGVQLPTPRFSECRNSITNSTSIQSYVPLQIYLFTNGNYKQSFKLSWRMTPVDPPFG